MKHLVFYGLNCVPAKILILKHNPPVPQNVDCTILFGHKAFKMVIKMMDPNTMSLDHKRTFNHTRDIKDAHAQRKDL